MTTLPSLRLPTLDQLVLRLIAWYQRCISPYKGFRCACAALHGGPSCSAAVAHIIRTRGLDSGRADITAQFARCREAHMVLRSGFGGGVGPSGGGQAGGGGNMSGSAGGTRVRRGGVQGVFCCGPVPIPFRCG